MEALAETPIHVVYRPGRAAAVPDALSRLPTEPAGEAGLPEEPSLCTVLVEPGFLSRISAA